LDPTWTQRHLHRTKFTPQIHSIFNRHDLKTEVAEPWLIRYDLNIAIQQIAGHPNLGRFKDCIPPANPVWRFQNWL
jgi:hypothetical protein